MLMKVLTRFSANWQYRGIMQFSLRSTLFFIGFLLLGSALQAGEFDWPVEKDRKFQISSTFGESRIDHFHNGIDIPGEGNKVIAPKDARVLYKIESESIAGEMPFGGGNTVVLDHATSWTGYMHLKSMSNAITTGAPIARGEQFGTSGNTGHSGGPHLHFFIYNPAERSMYNPLAHLVDDRYYRDTKPPESKEWGVLLPDKFANINPAKAFRLTADYPVYIFLQDHGIGRERWGVYEYRVLLDGKEALAAKFDKILFKENFWQLANGFSFEDLYYRNLYTLTKGVRRARQVTVEAADLRGHKFSQNFELKIQQN
jgi:hypothetical protein